MIELIYNEEEKYTADEKVLSEPKNVKQIGEPKEYKKIFIEDYVHTFLLQYSGKEEGKTRAAILLGSAKRFGGVRQLYIKGALPVEQLTEKQGKYIFSEKMWGEIYQQCEKYFPEQEIMGWFLSRPGFVVEKTSVTEETHRTYFSGADKVLFMMEPLEGESSFFGFDGNRFTKQPGFYIYYEKNEPMQEFLMKKNQTEKTLKEREKPDVVTANFRKILQEKQVQTAKRKKTAVSYGMKISIALILFVGAVTLKNQTEKIHTMEEQMSQMSGQEAVQQVSGTDVVVEELPGNVEEQQETVQETAILEEAEQELPITEPEEAPHEEPPVEETPQEEEPPTEETAAELPVQESYTIRSGDSLAKISRDKYGSDEMVDEICALNGIENGDYIQVGETILLP